MQPRQDSNLDQVLRTRLFYPLNYGGSLVNACPFELPKKFWAFLLERVEVPNDAVWLDLGKKVKNKLVNTLLNNVYGVRGRARWTTDAPFVNNNILLPRCHPTEGDVLATNPTFMKFATPIFLLCSLFLLVGCSESVRDMHTSTIKSRNVQLDPIKADLSVDNSNLLSGSSETVYFLIFPVKRDKNTIDTGGLFGSPLERTKGAALYNATNGKDLDVLVHPSYTITTKWWLLGTTIEAKVTGYAGKYSNFRTESPLQDELNRIIAEKSQIIIEQD